MGDKDSEQTAADLDRQAAYGQLWLALQKLDDLGEDLTLIPPVGDQPQIIDGRSALLARFDGEWKFKQEQRKG